jgi:hypothetical protein
MMAPSDKATLTASMRARSSARESGSNDGPVTNSSPMTGTAMRKTAPHQKAPSSSPPTAGPSTTPPMSAVPQTPMAVAICRGSGNISLMSASTDGSVVAAQIPSSARAAISMTVEVE